MRIAAGGTGVDPRGTLASRPPHRRFAGGRRHPGRLRRRDEIRDQRATDQPHAFRAFSGRDRPRARDQGMLQAFSGQRDARPRRARVGDDDRGARLGARSRRPGGSRPSGALQGRCPRDARVARRVPGQGGDAIEVVSPSHTLEQTAEYARHARTFGLLASSGSDYHGPGEGWADLGDMPPLPAGLSPVWKDW